MIRPIVRPPAPRRRAFPAPALVLLAVACAAGPWAAPARAQADPQPAAEAKAEILDGANLFSEQALGRARADLRKAAAAEGVPVTIETIDSLSGADVVEEARRRATDLGRRGIYILIARRDAKLDVLVPPAYRDRLSEGGRKAVQDAMVEEFKARRFDDGLAGAIAALNRSLAASGVNAALGIGPTSAPPPGQARPGPAGARSPLVVRDRVRLTLAGARRILEGAEAKAVEMGFKAIIAVVDDGGHMVAFMRMDEARPASVATATAKAVSAATFRQPSGPLPLGADTPNLQLGIGLEHAAASGGATITTLLGGIPVTVDGQIIGAVGVAGSTGERDAQVAQAGLDAFLAEIQAGEPAPGR